MKQGNTPITELLAEYEAENCDHSNLLWASLAAQRYVQGMADSQARCLLHVLSIEMLKRVEWQGGSPSRSADSAWLRLEGAEGKTRITLGHRCPQGEWLEMAPSGPGRELAPRQIDELITHHILLAAPGWQGKQKD